MIVIIIIMISIITSSSNNGGKKYIPVFHVMVIIVKIKTDLNIIEIHVQTVHCH